MRNSRPRMTPNVTRLLLLMGPALLTGGVTQINLLVGQIIASAQDGAIALVEQKTALMDKLGQKRLSVRLADPLSHVPEALAGYDLTLEDAGRTLVYTYSAHNEASNIRPLFADLEAAGIDYVDIDTKQSSLEEIFVDLVGDKS